MSSDPKAKELPFWRRAAQQVQQVTEGLKSTADSAQSFVTQAVDQTLQTTQETMSATTTKLSDITSQATRLVGDATSAISEGAQRAQQEGTRIARVAQESVTEQLNQAVSHTESAIQVVSDHVADGVTYVAGERGEVVSDFVRDGGLMTVAGLAFTPIALARRGVDTYQSSQEFMRGDSTLGVYLVKLISPSIVDAQAYLKDPDNQSKILDTLSKVIPKEMTKQLFGSISSVSDQVTEGVSSAPLSGEALEKFNELMNYRRPRAEPTESGEDVEKKPADVESSETENISEKTTAIETSLEANPIVSEVTEAVGTDDSPSLRDVSVDVSREADVDPNL